MCTWNINQTECGQSTITGRRERIHCASAPFSASPAPSSKANHCMHTCHCRCADGSSCSIHLMTRDSGREGLLLLGLGDGLYLNASYKPFQCQHSPSTFPHGVACSSQGGVQRTTTSGQSKAHAHPVSEPLMQSISTSADCLSGPRRHFVRLYSIGTRASRSTCLGTVEPAQIVAIVSLRART
jgi:hypothetical protein